MGTRVFLTCVRRAVVVIVLLSVHLQVGLILSHQLQLADLSGSVLDSLWYLQHNTAAFSE